MLSGKQKRSVRIPRRGPNQDKRKNLRSRMSQLIAKRVRLKTQRMTSLARRRQRNHHAGTRIKKMKKLTIKKQSKLKMMKRPKLKENLKRCLILLQKVL